MMENKHYEALGAMVRRLVEGKRLDDRALGTMIEVYIQVFEKEAMRDAREEKNK